MNTKFLSHWSALRHWNPPWVIPIIEETSHLCPELFPNVTHYTVTDPNARQKTRDAIYHSCTVALAAGALQESLEGLIASPEFAFLQVAEDLTMHQLVLLGHALCAMDLEYNRKPLTSVAELRSFALHMRRHRGRGRVLRACRYIHDRAGSLPEMLMAMHLGLPQQLGGMGLTAYELNHEIRLTRDEAYAVGQQRFFVDMLHLDTNLVLELDGFKYHSSRGALTQDIRRMCLLEAKGYRVVRVVSSQLTHLDEYFLLVRTIFMRMHRQIRIRTRSFIIEFQKLHYLTRCALSPMGSSVIKWRLSDQSALVSFTQSLPEHSRP